MQRVIALDIMNDKMSSYVATAGHASPLSIDLLRDLTLTVKFTVAGQYGIDELSDYLARLANEGPTSCTDWQFINHYLGPTQCSI
eukprot:6129548-Karenia_brevis.AAC.1